MKKISLLILVFIGVACYSQDVIVIMKNDKIVFTGTAADAKPLVDDYMEWCKDKRVTQLVSSSYQPDSLSAVLYCENAERLRNLEGGHKVFSKFQTEIYYDKESDGWYVKFIQEAPLNPRIDSKDGWLDWL